MSTKRVRLLGTGNAPLFPARQVGSEPGLRFFLTVTCVLVSLTPVTEGLGKKTTSVLFRATPGGAQGCARASLLVCSYGGLGLNPGWHMRGGHPTQRTTPPPPQPDLPAGPSSSGPAETRLFSVTVNQSHRQSRTSLSSCFDTGLESRGAGGGETLCRDKTGSCGGSWGLWPCRTPVGEHGSRGLHRATFSDDAATTGPDPPQRHTHGTFPHSWPVACSRLRPTQWPRSCISTSTSRASRGPGLKKPPAGPREM